MVRYSSYLEELISRRDLQVTAMGVVTIVTILSLSAFGPLTIHGAAHGAGLIEREHKYNDGNDELVGWLIYQDIPENAKRPGLIVYVGPYGDGGGKNERDFARTYARKGMVVFLPDYFPGRHSDEDPAQVQAAVAAYGPFLKDPPKAQRIALRALEQLTSLDFVDADKVGVVGFCFGGAMALNMARAGGKAKVVVSLHGEYPERGDPTASYNVDYFVEMLGDSDPFIPTEARDAWIKELSDYTKGTNMNYDVEIWGNSVHAFSIKYSDAFNAVIAAVTGSVVDDTGVTGVVRYEPDRAAASFDRVDDLFAQHGLLASAGLPLVAVNASSAGYCTVGSACWPDSNVWKQLSDDLGTGVLKTIAGAEAVSAECLAALGPGARGVQESLGATIVNQAANGTCSFAGTCIFEGCNPAQPPRLPVYSVEAKTVDHVKKAVAFASKHKIRVSVKSTGADYTVANSQRDSILIWMSNYQGHSTEGVTEGFKDSCDTAHAAVLKVGGGETWGGVFNALAADGRFEASSGAAVTVGASGGWLQGGGLGPLDRQLGLGIDNAVQFEVVTADGSLKTADACTEPDLFWALRGGGGGNWGVVVSSTSKVHPKKPMVRVRIGWFGTPAFGQPPASQAPIGMELPLPASILMDPAGLKANKTAVFGDTQSNTLERWHEAMLGVMNPATMDDRFDGYYGTGCSWLGFACADGYFRGTMAELEEVVLKELRTVLQMTKQGNGAVGDAFFYSAMESASFYDYASQDCVSATAGSPQAYICNQIGYPSANGYNTDSQRGAGVYGTQLVWLVPSSLFTTEKPKMRELLKTPYGRLMIGHIIGGQVSRPAATDTAINPAVRTSAMHFILPTAFDANSPSMENVRAFIGRARFFAKISEHADGERRGPVSI